MNALPQRISLVAQTATVLKEGIAAGRWTGRLPGEPELCRLLHVGRTTLRSALAALQREGWVRTRQGKRREIVRRRRIATSPPSDRVALLTSLRLLALPTTTIFWVDCLREHLAEAGYHLEIHERPACYTGRPERALEALALQLRPAGWVLCQSTARMQRWFSERRMPCVITGSPHPGVRLPSVDRDYRAISRHAAGAFLARGHRQLVMFNPASGRAGDHESEQGFKEGVEKSRVPDVQHFIARHCGSVADVCKKLSTLLGCSPPPTALLVSQPNHVLTVMTSLMARGLRFPKDVALISRDDDPLLENLVPSVARYTLNPSVFAQTISKIVLAIVRDGMANPKEYLMMPRFVHGQTLG